jgi:hypothetical protein
MVEEKYSPEYIKKNSFHAWKTWERNEKYEN